MEGRQCKQIDTLWVKLYFTNFIVSVFSCDGLHKLFIFESPPNVNLQVDIIL